MTPDKIASIDGIASIFCRHFDTESVDNPFGCLERCLQCGKVSINGGDWQE